MATKSRTYLPTDWQVWMYTPVSGKFRLDFSALNGADVLGGSTDTGSMAVVPLELTSISINDGEEPINSVLANIGPATASISAETNSWDANFVKELYPGKALTITLKNEASNDVDVYGRNSVFFMGNIAETVYEVDPVNLVTNFTINATDIFGAAVNQVVPITKSTSSTQSSTLDGAINNNLAMFNSHLHFLWFTDLASTYEANESVSLSLGSLLSDFIASEVAVPVSYYVNLGLGVLERQLYFNALHATPTSGTQITDSMVTAVRMGTDGGDLPTTFALANSTISYTKGSTASNTLGNPNAYNASIPVFGSTQLQNIADRIQTYNPALSPMEITVKTAMPFQTITFDTTHPQGGSDYYYPTRHYANGTNLDIYLAYLGSSHYYAKIIGQSHEITNDSWLTTYKLMKGK